MEILKNKWRYLYQFVLYLTFVFTLIYCKPYEINTIEGKIIGLKDTIAEDLEIANFILPYHKHLNNDLDSILAFNPENLDKSKGKWETNIGNLLADICLSQANSLMQKKHQKEVSVCLLNHGGIRNIIPKGNISARNAFEVMPFENSLVVLEISGKNMFELANFFINEKRAHPLAGIEIILSHDTINEINIQGKPIDLDQFYLVATSDYLAEGGDRMVFFKSPEKFYDLNFKIRNIVIDHFKAVDTLKINKNPRILIR